MAMGTLEKNHVSVHVLLSAKDDFPAPTQTNVSTGSQYPEYSGMNYSDASKEADRLIRKEGWFRNFGKLCELQAIMMRLS